MQHQQLPVPAAHNANMQYILHTPTTPLQGSLVFGPVFASGPQPTPIQPMPGGQSSTLSAGPALDQWPGRGDGRFTTVWDFLFTDTLNHIEFLKHIQHLGESDDALLVGCLERLAAEGSDFNLHSVTHPYIGERVRYSEIDPKNDLNPANPRPVKSVWSVMKAHTEMMRLRGHQANIYEVALLFGVPVGHEGKKAAESKTLFVVAIGCFFIQITLFSVLVWYWIKENEWEKVGQQGREGWPDSPIHHEKDDIIHKEDSKGFANTVIIVICTSVVFARMAYTQSKTCFTAHRFFKAMRRYRKSIFDSKEKNALTLELERPIFWKIGRFHMVNTILFFNVVSNQILPLFICVFNVLWLMSQPTPQDAILNSLTLMFLWDLDDLVVPDAYKDVTWQTDKLAESLCVRLLWSFGNQETIGYEKKMWQPSVRRVGLQRRYTDDDKLYVRIPKNAEKNAPTEDACSGCNATGHRGCTETKITVYRRMNAGEYETIEYYVTEHRHDDATPEKKPDEKDSFLALARKFKCLERMKDLDTGIDQFIKTSAPLQKQIQGELTHV